MAQASHACNKMGRTISRYKVLSGFIQALKDLQTGI
jgi:hypothetical protein